MAVTTVDGAGAGAVPPRFLVKPGSTAVAGRAQTLWASLGTPGPGSYDTTINGVALAGNSVNGQIPRTNPVSGNSYLNRLQAAASQAGVLLLLDRLWHNGGLSATTTGAQAITFPGLPARDVNGSTNGDGVLAALEISAATGAGAATPTLSYTNEAGVAGRSATLATPYAASSIINSMYFFGLQAGDKGMRSLQSLALNTSMTSGTINLVLFRIIASLELSGAYVPNAIDWVTAGGPRIFDNSVPFLAFIPSGTSAPSISGSYIETQG